MGIGEERIDAVAFGRTGQEIIATVRFARDGLRRTAAESPGDLGVNGVAAKPAVVADMHRGRAGHVVRDHGQRVVGLGASESHWIEDVEQPAQNRKRMCRWTSVGRLQGLLQLAFDAASQRLGADGQAVGRTGQTTSGSAGPEFQCSTSGPWPQDDHYYF